MGFYPSKSGEFGWQIWAILSMKIHLYTFKLYFFKLKFQKKLPIKEMLWSSYIHKKLGRRKHFLEGAYNINSLNTIFGTFGKDGTFHVRFPKIMNLTCKVPPLLSPLPLEESLLHKPPLIFEPTPLGYNY
jgi:hypothetical protein